MLAFGKRGLSSLIHVEGVGEGVFEYKIDFGPGYRIYFLVPLDQSTVRYLGIEVDDALAMSEQTEV